MYAQDVCRKPRLNTLISHKRFNTDLSARDNPARPYTTLSSKYVRARLGARFGEGGRVTDDVLSDVVHVPLDGGHDHHACVAGGAPAVQPLLLLDVGDEVGHSLLHHPRRLDYLYVRGSGFGV